MLYRFESVDGRNVHEGDGGEIQDQTVEVDPRNADVCGNDAEIAEAVQLFALAVVLLAFIDQIPQAALFADD